MDRDRDGEHMARTKFGWHVKDLHFIILFYCGNFLNYKIMWNQCTIIYWYII